MEKTIREIREQKPFGWERVKPFTPFQILLSFLIPSAIATLLFHAALPILVSGGLSPIVAWPIVACLGLMALVGFAFWILRKEAVQLNIYMSERMLFAKLHAKQWMLYLGISVIGVMVSVVALKGVLPLMKLTGFSVPDYYPFWLNPAIDAGAVNPHVPIQGFILSGAYKLIPLMGFTLLLNILAEEFYFRAWILPKIQRFGHWAWALNGLLFALYHVFQFWMLPVILPMSLIMAFIAWHSKSIWPALVVHLIVNFFGTILNLILMVA